MWWNVHVGDDVASFYPLPALNSNKGLVETRTAGIDHRLDTVMEMNGMVILEAYCERDPIAVVGDTLVEDTVKHLALLEGFVDAGNVTISHGIDRGIAGRPGRVELPGRGLKVNMRPRVRLGSASSLVGMAGTHVLPVDDKSRRGLLLQLLDVRKLVGSLQRGLEIPANGKGKDGTPTSGT